MVAWPSPCWEWDRPLPAATCHPKTRLLRGRGGLATAPPTTRAMCLSQPTVLQGSGVENWQAGTSAGGPGVAPGTPTDCRGLWDQSLCLSPPRDAEADSGGGWELVGGGGLGGRRWPWVGRRPEPAVPSAADVNECRRYPGRLCGHKCENTPGSYFCSCTVGFRLSADGRSCEGEAMWPGRGAPGPRLLGRAAAQPADPWDGLEFVSPARIRRCAGWGSACRRWLVREDCSPSPSRALECLVASAQSHAVGWIGQRSCVGHGRECGIWRHLTHPVPT